MVWKYIEKRAKMLVIVVSIGLLGGALGFQALKFWLGALALGEVVGDVNLEGISLEVAQRRTPFPICFPEWIPEGLEGPFITYHADFGDPMEATISLKYQYNGRLFLQIDQHLAAAQVRTGFQSQDKTSTSVASSIDPDDVDVIKRRILAWQVGWSNVDAWLPMGTLRYYFLTEKNHRYLVTELTSPSEYHAYLIYWSHLPLPESNEHYVAYELFSRLPETETLSIARSISYCVPSLWEFPRPSPTPVAANP